MVTSAMNLLASPGINASENPGEDGDGDGDGDGAAAAPEPSGDDQSRAMMPMTASSPTRAAAAASHGNRCRRAPTDSSCGTSSEDPAAGVSTAWGVFAATRTDTAVPG